MLYASMQAKLLFSKAYLCLNRKVKTISCLEDNTIFFPLKYFFLSLKVLVDSHYALSITIYIFVPTTTTIINY